MKATRQMNISIVIPVYNKAAFVLDSIESCLWQTYKDFEIIIIDDSSEDDSFQLINDYVANNNQCLIRVFKNKQNKGVSYSRNMGIKLSKGNYVLFLDADDMLHPEAISIMWQLVSEFDLDFLCPNRNYFWDTCRFESLSYDQRTQSSVLVEPPQSIVGCLIKRKVIEQRRVCFEESLRNGEDTLFSTWLFCVAKKMRSHNNALYMIRRGMEHSLSKGQWNNPDVEIPRERHILQYMQKYYDAGFFQSD